MCKQEENEQPMANTVEARPSAREVIQRRIYNLRAEADPATLQAITRDALAGALGDRPRLTWTVEHSEHFQPAPPKPTHRITHPDPTVRVPAR